MLTRVLFGKKVIQCASCGKELKHKYKPHPDWGIQGFLCGDCHIEKTKEFALREQEEKEICAMCKKNLKDDERHKPRWQWNLELESGTFVCTKCFERTEAEYEKRLNYCIVCNQKLSMFRYNPKPAWSIKGQLCRKCWDAKNHKREAL